VTSVPPWFLNQVALKKVAKLNVDEAPTIAQRFGIQSIPTLIVFKDGKPAQQFVGVTQVDALVPALTR
jgi:thioredoxin 1